MLVSSTTKMKRWTPSVLGKTDLLSEQDLVAVSLRCLERHKGIDALHTGAVVKCFS